MAERKTGDSGVQGEGDYRAARTYKRDIDNFMTKKGSIDIEVDGAELQRRRAQWKSKPLAFGSGALWRYAQNVGSARYGAVTHPGAKAEVRCYADI